MELTVAIAITGIVLSIMTFFAGAKKTSNADVEKRARFEGEIKAKLDQLIKSVEQLEDKLSRNKNELYAEIRRQIQEHERHYHNGTGSDERTG